MIAHLEAALGLNVTCQKDLLNFYTAVLRHQTFTITTTSNFYTDPC